MSEKFFPSFPEVARPKTAESPLKNPDNMMKLFLRLQNVYSDRPDTSKYKGAMADTKFADEYSDEEIAKASDDVKGKNELDAVIAYLQVLGIHRK